MGVESGGGWFYLLVYFKTNKIFKKEDSHPAVKITGGLCIFTQLLPVAGPDIMIVYAYHQTLTVD